MAGESLYKVLVRRTLSQSPGTSVFGLRQVTLGTIQCVVGSRPRIGYSIDSKGKGSLLSFCGEEISRFSHFLKGFRCVDHSPTRSKVWVHTEVARRRGLVCIVILRKCPVSI